MEQEDTGKKSEHKIEKEIEKTEKEIAKEVSKDIEEKLPEKEIKEDVNEKVEELKKEIKEEKPKKTEAVVNGRNLPISTKYAIAICNVIRGKNIEQAISILEQAKNMKIAIPIKGEIPHKKAIMSGRYPIKAIKEFIKLLRSLNSNAIANELELEKCKIICKANIASRPYRRFGRGRFKRSHVEIKLIKPIKPISPQESSEKEIGSSRKSDTEKNKIKETIK